MDAYAEFLARKKILDPMTGIAGWGIDLPDFFKPHQASITRWALQRGRSAVFAGTGLGKTLIEGVWCDAVAEYTELPTLIMAPLAVAQQIVRELKKFGIGARFVNDQSEIRPGVNVTNYAKADRFDFSKFGGIALDESSILKSVDGKTRTMLIRKCAGIPFRLCATATPAPNDYMELGSHAEFLGVMSYTDMLATFFAHDGGDTKSWRLKGHAEADFWRWMASWAVMLRKPSDLGYPDDGYDLPPLHYHHHRVAVDYKPSFEAGTLFPMEARTLRERLGARKESVADRVKHAVEITPRQEPFVWWCNLNEEAELLAKNIPGAVNLTGSDLDTVKERKLLGFSNGDYLHLVTKPSIAGFGMNWQHCWQTGFVGLNDSWEQIYQALRRFWRFGQTREVHGHFIASEREGAVVANFRRKDAQAEHMAAQMVAHMADLSSAEVRGMVRDTGIYAPAMQMQIPTWMEAA